MADGMAVLDDWIERVRSLPALAVEAAPEAARVVDEHLRANIAAGVDPNGKPWPLTEDGRQALQHAEKALTVTSSGPVVLARLSGIEAAHHLGAVRGGVKRQILPTSKIPGTLAVALERVAGTAFSKHMGGK